MTPPSAAALPIAAAETPAAAAPVVPILDPVTFPEGLFGFPECHDFMLSTTARAGFYWLRSRQHANLTFVLADPFVYFDTYAVDLEEADLAALAATGSGDIAVLAIVTLPRLPGEPLTANLQGPIALNLRNGVARQVILADSPFGLRCPFRVETADAA